MSHGFLDVALALLAAAVFFVSLCQRLGLGSVLGYLVAGVVVGPSVLGLVPAAQDLLHFSELGVVFLLFVIGLELDPKRLWALRGPIFGLGGAQVAGNALLFTGAGLALGVDWSVSVVAALGFALSSTAMAVQLMQERSWLNTRGGHAAFSILLFQDIAVIPMVALLPLLAEKVVASPGGALSSEPSGARGALLVAGVLVGAVVVGRLALRPLLRLVAAAHLREVFTAVSLLVVIGMAALMAHLELSMGLGAFMAGVLLADSEYRHALESDIEPFKGLLLGLFFLSVGMSIDLHAVGNAPGLVVGLAALVMATKGLWHAALARVGTVPAGQVLRFSLTIGQVGEFAFVLFGAAAGLGLLSSEQLTLLTAVVALTMVLSPLANLAADRILAARAARTKRAPADNISNDDPEVIIAGFGRFGQIIARLLYANGVRCTVLDFEPDQIELMRRFGFKVFYGDATRLELLEAAGAHRAHILVVAIDSPEQATELVDNARRHFPHLRLFARARNVQHAYELLDRPGVDFERETFESSLALGRRILVASGLGAHSAWKAANRFRDHNQALLAELHAVRSDAAALTARAKQARADLESMVSRDPPPASWD